MDGTGPYQQLRCTLHRLCLPCHTASLRLARFGLIAHRTGSRYSPILQMCAVRVSCSRLLLYIYRLPKPVPDFLIILFPCSRIRATPNLRSLNQPHLAVALSAISGSSS